MLVVITQRMTVIIFILSLISCGSAPINRADLEAYRQGSKSMLYTDNQTLLEFFNPFNLLNIFEKVPVEAKILKIDGVDVDDSYENQKIVIDSGVHEIELLCKSSKDEKLYSINKIIKLNFIGGNKYKVVGFNEFMSRKCARIEIIEQSVVLKIDREEHLTQ